MTTIEKIAGAIGIVGIIISIIIYQQRKGRKLLIWKLVSDVVWLLQYALLGKYTGAAVCGVAIVRESVFLNQHRKWAQSKLWLLFFLVLSVVTSIITWGSLFSILPLVASAIAVFSFWRNNPTLSKILAYPICFCMLTYDIYGTGSVSYMGVVNETLTLISTTVSLVLVYRGRRAASSAEKSDSEASDTENADATVTES